VSNCFRQWAACNSTISARFLAPAKLWARSKQEFRFRWAMSMILRLNAAAPHPAASKDLSKVVIDASRASLERSLGLARLAHGLLVKGSHGLGNGGVES
jgi:hypothetical protein